MPSIRDGDDEDGTPWCRTRSELWRTLRSPRRTSGGEAAACPRGKSSECAAHFSRVPGVAGFAAEAQASDGRRRSDGDRPGGSLPGSTCRTAAGGQRRRCRGPGQQGLPLQVRLRPSRVRRSVTTSLTGRPLSPSINLAIGASGTADTPVIGPKPDLGGARSSPLSRTTAAARRVRWALRPLGSFPRVVSSNSAHGRPAPEQPFGVADDNSDCLSPVGPRYEAETLDAGIEFSGNAGRSACSSLQRRVQPHWRRRVNPMR
ncbi:hypothetical protein HPB47_008587, partial [Ixodes persulcatus]